MHNYILLYPYATLDSNAIPILSLTHHNWVITAKSRAPNGAGNVILQQLTCVCLIGWELNHDFDACLLKISFHVQHVFTIFLYNAVVLESQLLVH